MNEKTRQVYEGPAVGKKATYDQVAAESKRKDYAMHDLRKPLEDGFSSQTELSEFIRRQNFPWIIPNNFDDGSSTQDAFVELGFTVVTNYDLRAPFYFAFPPETIEAMAALSKDPSGESSFIIKKDGKPLFEFRANQNGSHLKRL